MTFEFSVFPLSRPKDGRGCPIGRVRALSWQKIEPSKFLFVSRKSPHPRFAPPLPLLCNGRRGKQGRGVHPYLADARTYEPRTCAPCHLAPCLSAPGPLGSGRSLGHTRERPVKTGAEGATAPETLRQKDRVRSPTLESRGKPLTEGAKSMCRSDMGEISQVLRQRGQAWLLPGLAQPCRNREIEWQRRLRRFSAPPSTIFM